MNLSTTYLGMTLRTPLMPSASPLSKDLDNIKRMEDAGASAVVLHSLFEEELRLGRFELHHHLTAGSESYPEALSYFPDPSHKKSGPAAYVEHLARAKAAVDIPVIASLNGSTIGGWLHYAREIDQAGADALELNIYSIPSDAELTSGEIEETCLEIVRAVKREISIPLAVKVSPFFTNFANMAKRLDQAGAGALVLFNRFYQPDIDLLTMEVTPNILPSTPLEGRLPMRWIAMLHGRIGADLAATGGIHSGTDALKMIAAGADVAMLCSALLQCGIGHLRTVQKEMTAWLEKNEYESVAQLKGSMSQKNCPDPSAFERAQYMRAVSLPAGAFGIMPRAPSDT